MGELGHAIMNFKSYRKNHDECPKVFALALNRVYLALKIRGGSALEFSGPRLVVGQGALFQAA